MSRGVEISRNVHRPPIEGFSNVKGPFFIMLGRKHKGRRFNRLLLCEGEDYLGDYGCVYYATKSHPQSAFASLEKGRLRVCLSL